MAVLLVEHYAPLARALVRGLGEEGIVLHWAPDDVEADVRLRAGPCAAAVVAWNVPRQGGPALVRRWRHAGVTVPVLLFVPSAGDANHRAGLAAGADEVIPLPFCFDELLARLRAYTLLSSVIGKERA
jgi:DNA-binding response OmpR family regulator